ncbi:MAG: xanthine dehydrogenase family protein subunit M [Candidatus Thermoplasmatota archaeon]|jgi:carbon-monoxide dehydrogenase medium subunit|nr:xanthine dehydrogenase family protein subunit M [Candidatus Thermoplasmatota archaeon]MDA8144043.1 xanthine dehydrogenase family protein subunit M [Thermoplasmatales archaeon]
MRPRPFDFYQPTSIKEASEILHSHEDAKPLAGGQSLIPMMKLRIFSPSEIMSLAKIKEMKPYISETGQILKIGAMATHDMIHRSDVLRNAVPVLSEAAGEIADQQIRNRGTIGGNIAHGDPSTNLSAALLALDAEIEVQGIEGTRIIPIDEFFLDLFTTALDHGEIITEFRVKASPHTKQKFMKVAKSDTAFPMAFVALNVGLSEGFVENARIALGVAGPTPLRALEAEKFLLKKRLDSEVITKAAQIATKDLEPPSDVHASEEYRKQLLSTLIKRGLSSFVG